MLDLNIIEHHPQRVLAAFRRGDFDQLEIVGQADEEGVLRVVLQRKDFGGLGQRVPHGPKKEEVPLWFLLAANLSLKLRVNAVQNNFEASSRRNML